MLMTEPHPLRPFVIVRRTAALATFAFASTLALQAQQSAPAVESGSSATSAAAPLVASSATPPFSLSSVAGISYASSSSSTTDAVDPVEAERLNLAGVPGDTTQPPPRRRYGRPRYNDSSHNPDGSNKYAFIVGAGLTAPSGNTYRYLNTGYAFQVGAGRNFNKNLSLLVQFDYDHFGFNGRTLYNESIIEDPYNNYGVQGNLDGNSHIWSLSLNPVYNIYSSEGLGAYVVGGVGFYHKVANFTVDVPVTSYYYGFPISYVASETIDHYTSNAPGFNAGFGLTYKPSRFAGERLYAEVRYVFIDNQQRYGVTPATIYTYQGYNLYPQNSNRTGYFPIKVGIRF